MDYDIYDLPEDTLFCYKAADALRRLGYSDWRETLYRDRSLWRLKEKFGDRHPEVARCLGHMAEIACHDQDRSTEAEELFVRAIDMLTVGHGQKWPYGGDKAVRNRVREEILLPMLQNYAIFMWMSRRPDQGWNYEAAYKAFESYIGLIKRLRPGASKELAEAQMQLGLVHFRKGMSDRSRREEAMRLSQRHLERALKTYQACCEPHHYKVHEAAAMIGGLHTEWGKLIAAEVKEMDQALLDGEAAKAALPH